jgi:hypothetical protein
MLGRTLIGVCTPGGVCGARRDAETLPWPIDPATVYQTTQALPRLDLGGYFIDFTGGNRNGVNRVFMSLISRDGKLLS